MEGKGRPRGTAGLLAVLETFRGAVEHILGGFLDLLLHLGWDLGFVESLALLLEPLAALLAPLDEVIRGGDDGVRIALGKLDRLFRGLRVRSEERRVGKEGTSGMKPHGGT